MMSFSLKGKIYHRYRELPGSRGWISQIPLYLHPFSRTVRLLKTSKIPFTPTPKDGVWHAYTTVVLHVTCSRWGVFRRNLVNISSHVLHLARRRSGYHSPEALSIPFPKTFLVHRRASRIVFANIQISMLNDTKLPMQYAEVGAWPLVKA